MRYLRRTLANKLVALLMVAMGYLSIGILNDAVIFIFVLMIALCLFFSNENYIC